MRYGGHHARARSKPQRERYRDDPIFHALVESLVQLIAEEQTTVRELHAAVDLAQTRYEMSRRVGTEEAL